MKAPRGIRNISDHASSRIVAFLLKRLAQMLLLSLLVTFMTFGMSSLIPGDFFSTYVITSTFNSDSIDQLRHNYGLDMPFYIQYSRWLKNLLHMDLGYSLFYQRPVANVVFDALKKTLWLGMPAILLGFGLGILIGTIHGIHGERILGRFFDFLSSILLSLPSILLGLIAMLFAAHTGWFPLGGMSSSFLPDIGFWSSLADRIHHLVLPVACLSIPTFAYVERTQYSSTKHGDDTPAVRFARARGLSTSRIFIQYILRPGLNPVLSVSGPMLGGILSGSLVLEVIFAWPGLGQITYDALFNNDLFLLAGCVLGSSALLVLGNLVADCALMILDPRVRSSLWKEK